MRFARVKGDAEAALIELAKATPNLNVYNVRPGFVDTLSHPEVAEVEKGRKIGWVKSALKTYFAGIFRFCYPNMVSPTKHLGKVLTDLAMGDGRDLEGKGVDDKGRTLTNIGLRRLAGI